jgi:hypothetical protein
MVDTSSGFLPFKQIVFLMKDSVGISSMGVQKRHMGKEDDYRPSWLSALELHAFVKYNYEASTSRRSRSSMNNRKMGIYCKIHFHINITAYVRVVPYNLMDQPLPNKLETDNPFA